MDNYNNVNGNTVGYTGNTGYDSYGQPVVQKPPVQQVQQPVQEFQQTPVQQPVQTVQQTQPVQGFQQTPVQQVEAQQTARTTLGAELRAISEVARPRAEIQKLTEILKEKAKQGYTEVKFNDLRTHVPSMAKYGVEALQSWCNNEELKLAGQVNPSTAAWEFVISW